MALRHRFSPGLPLSDVVLCQYSSIDIADYSLQTALKIRCRSVTAAKRKLRHYEANTWFPLRFTDKHLIVKRQSAILFSYLNGLITEALGS